MARREDCRETRERLLNAVCEVFGQKGYHNATVADICRRARANVAVVNYYFGEKASLYSEAWRYAFNEYAIPLYKILWEKDVTTTLRACT